MLTPFEITERVAKMRRLGGPGIGTSHYMAAERLKRELYLDVLTEIAKGTLDARSLAIAALEAERDG